MQVDQSITDMFFAATNEQDLRRAVERITDHFDANGYGVGRFASVTHGPALDYMSNQNDEFQRQMETPEFRPSVDPVMQHLRLSSAPLIWDRKTYMDAGCSHMYEAMADFSMGSGLAVAVHLGAYRHFTMGFTWPHGTKPDTQMMMSALQLYSIYAEQAFHRVWTRLQLELLAPSSELTEAELQCLYWAARGRTNPLIAVVLNLKTRTVETRIQSAMAKLGASTRTEAVVTAERLQLMTPFHLLHAKPRIAPR